VSEIRLDQSPNLNAGRIDHKNIHKGTYIIFTEIYLTNTLPKENEVEKIKTEKNRRNNNRNKPKSRQ